MVIYKTTNILTGEYYIGKDIHNNPNYLGSGLILRRAILKYGKASFIKEIIQICKDVNELNECERSIITEEIIKDPLSYNLALGGQGGNLYTYEQKVEMGILKRVSESLKGRKLSEEHIEKIKRGMDPYRSIRDIEHKQPKKAHYGKDNHFFGKNHDGDMSRFGKHRKGITPTNAKAVICINTGIVYSSCRAASLEYPNPNGARTAISAVCRGLRNEYMNKKYAYV